MVLEKTLESPRKSVPNIHWKDWCWSWNSNTLATWCKELAHFKRPWCWERLKAGGKGDDRGWDGWMASLTQRTWVWVSSRSWWWTGKPGVLQSMGPQRVRHDWEAELNWAYLFSSRYSWLRNSTRVSCIAGRFFTNWALKPSLQHTATLLSFLKKKVKRTQQRPSLTQCPLKPLSCLFVFSFMEKKNLLWYLIIPGVSESSAHILFWIYENQSFTLILTYYIEDVHPKVTIWSLLSNPMVNSIHISLNSQHNLIELRNPSFSKFPHRVSWLPVYMSYTSSVRFIPRYWLAYAILKAF